MVMINFKTVFKDIMALSQLLGMLLFVSSLFQVNEAQSFNIRPSRSFSDGSTGPSTGFFSRRLNVSSSMVSTIDFPSRMRSSAFLPSPSSQTIPVVSSSVGPRVPRNASVWFHCDFERDTCSLRNTASAWQRRSGSTPSVETGPDVDATKGTNLGYYFYFEASFGSFGHAQFSSPIRSPRFCLDFAYHMYGTQIGSLTVGYQDRRRGSVQLWRKSGNQGNRWHRAQVEGDWSDSFNFEMIIYFEARRGNGFKGDIAIDDIRVIDCQGEIRPTQPTKTGFLPFGFQNNDQALRRGRYVSSCIPLHGKPPFPLFTLPARSRVCINSHGYLSVDNNLNQHPPPFGRNQFNIFAPYSNIMDSNGRNMFYRLATDRNTLELAKRDVARLNSGPSLSFNATQVIVVTYDNVNQHRGDSNRYHYQFALVTDGNVTYAVLNYERLDRNGPNGYTEPVGRRCFDITRRFASDVRSMVSTSNVGIPGKHVFLLTANDTGECINRKVLYPFGPSAGDKGGRAFGGRKIIIDLTRSWNLFSKPGKRLDLYTNGYIGVDRNDDRYFRPTNSRVSYIAPFYNSNLRSVLFTYYRETTDPNILAQATADIRSSPAGNMSGMVFNAETGFIATWSSNKRKFQVVLATDGLNETYAILNYQQLDEMPFASVEMNEVGCRYRQFFHNRGPNIFRDLIKGSNVGVQGRHVYRLSKPGCFKRFTGLRTAIFNPHLSGSNNIQLYTWRVTFFKQNEIISGVNVFVTEVYSTFPGQLLSVNINSRLVNTFSNVYQYRFSIFRATPASRHFSLNHPTVGMVITSDTPKTSDFQYGAVNLTTVQSDTECTAVYFTERMSSTPAIKITPRVDSNGELFKFVYAWLRGVDRDGFVVCVKELLEFSGKRDVQINYVASTATANESRQEDHIKETKRISLVPVIHNSSITCITRQLKHTYLRQPNIVTSVEVVGGGDSKAAGAAVSWVRLPNRRDWHTYEFCVSTKNPGKEHLIHVLVDGQISPCSMYECPTHLACQLRFGALPYCTCARECFEMKDVFCGSDHRTYSSMCELNRHHCLRHGNESTTSITKLHSGSCRFQPFQSGRTQLEPVPELPGIFCKYVSLERENFAKTANATRINIFLTVSWDQRDQEPFTNETMAKDASASWSEDVTDKGFKACVLVAGRHLASDFPAPPAVHWVAVQEEFFREGAKTKTIKVGSVVMDTWYTGTQCKRIPSRSYQTRYFVSVTHTEPRSFSNAMTVWTERDRRFGFAFVCARELQNFDGIHKGVVVHWMQLEGKSVTRTPLDLFMPEYKEVKFPRRPAHRVGQENPVQCKTLRYNFKFPSLRNPTVLVAGKHPSADSRFISSSAVYSHHDLAVWVERTEAAKLTVCAKVLRFSNTQQEGITVNVLVVADLCGDDGTYFRGSCYRKLPSAMPFEVSSAQCAERGATLPVIHTDAESVFIQERIKRPIWINLERFPPRSNMWQWADGSMTNVTKWYPGQPQNTPNHNCAVADNRGAMTGWRVEHCSAYREILCEKAVTVGDLTTKSCESYCLNGGECTYNNTNVNCTCPLEFAGQRCEEDLRKYEGCLNHTVHDEAWRNVKNLNNGTVFQSNNHSSCTNLTSIEWHRFVEPAGTKIWVSSSRFRDNHPICGSQQSGSILQYGFRNPTEIGQKVRARMGFYCKGCPSVFSDVDVLSCGDYFVYKFSGFNHPFSCNFGVCVTR